MSSADKNLSDHSQNSGNLSGINRKVAIVVADWNKEITEFLYEGAKNTLLEHGVKAEDIRTIRVPGTYELPQAAAIAFSPKASLEVDSVICIGCVIKGETSHNEYINQSVAHALQTLALQHLKPCIFGVLTPNTYQQALDRAGGKHGNKGAEAAVTALQMMNLEY